MVLCDDAWICITKFCDPKTLVQLSNTSKHFHSMVFENKIQKTRTCIDMTELIKHKNVRLLNTLIQKDYSSCYSENLKLLFQSAYRHGRVDITKYMLSDTRVNLISIGEAIKLAAEFGYAGVVEILLQDSRIEFEKVKVDIFKLAIAHGHTRILEILFADERMNFFDLIYLYGFYNIYESIQKKHVGNAKFLLSDSRVNPNGIYNTRILEYAVLNGCIEIIKFLLQGNPTIDNAKNLENAVQYGHLEIVDLFLQDKKIDPCICLKYAIRIACEKNYFEIVKLLTNDERVHLKTNYNQLIQVSSRMKNWKMFDLLTKRLENRNKRKQ